MFLENVYFQPPSNIQMVYPCIVYHKNPNFKRYGDNMIFIRKEVYQVKIIETDPESSIGNDMEEYFEYCSIVQVFTQDSLHHTVLRLYF